MTIEGIVSSHPNNSYNDLSRHRQIEGYCENILAGQVAIALNIGNCKGYSAHDSYTGRNSVSRIMIQEVPPPQND